MPPSSHQVLIYNVTHSDLMLGVSPSPSAPLVFARPRFSAYLSLGPVLQAACQRGRTAFADLHMDLLGDPGTPRGFGAAPGRPARIPVGFALGNEGGDGTLMTSWDGLHLRGGAIPPGGDGAMVPVREVYIPLAAQLIPAWKARVESFGEQCRTAVLLVCGAGRPQNPNERMEGNSTRSTAELIQAFLRKLHGMDQVHVVDSGYDVFSMDENVMFVRSHLLPLVEQIRREACGDAASGRWRDAMEVTLALTEGSPARMAALSAGLRPYRPFVAHMWQLKTFWHEGRLLASDVLFHSFDRVDTTPPMPVMDLSPTVRALVAEVRRYRKEFEACDKSELNSFWLRKSKKPVLSVLCIAKRGGTGVRFIRGLNLEVSQPTGSLCSERNAIGTALAEDPTLKRTELLMIAVLALPGVDTYMDGIAPHVRVPVPAPALTVRAHAAAAATAAAGPDGTESTATSHVANVKRQRSESTIRAPPVSVVVGHQNPLGPCGACNEWLKKIFEVNPDFRVVTFVDESCEYAFVKEVF